MEFKVTSISGKTPPLSYSYIRGSEYFIEVEDLADLLDLVEIQLNLTIKFVMVNSDFEIQVE